MSQTENFYDNRYSALKYRKGPCKKYLMETINILGISCFYHDSAACILKDGHILAAAQEERLTRKKHDPRFPRKAIAYCLEEAGISINVLDHVVFYDNPFLTFPENA